MGIVTAEVIRDIRIAKQKMENAIREAAVAATTEFKHETGLSPTAIKIEIIDCTGFDDDFKSTIVGEVTTQVWLPS